MPRLPKRTSDNKGKQNVDDLLRLFSIIDEQKLSSSLPLFSAFDLLRIPFLNQDSINLVYCETFVREATSAASVSQVDVATFVVEAWSAYIASAKHIIDKVQFTSSG